MSDKPLAGRYALIRQLGAGGNALVFEAKDLKVGRRVAVKVLAPSVAKDREQLLRIDREGRIAASVSHPNVCAITDIDKLDNGAPFLVLELLRGETLEARLERQRCLSVAEAVRIGEQLLAALAATHDLGIVHRDIKPNNVFLVDSGVPEAPIVKLIDFGTAQVPGMPEFDGQQLTRTGLVVGTAAYMSPEQVRGVRDFDPRTDVYSCGVLLFEALAGRRPFMEDSYPKLIEMIAFRAAPRLTSVAPNVPANVAHAIDTALAKEREHRHADALAFLAALRAPLTATGPSPLLSGATQILGREAETISSPPLRPTSAPARPLPASGPPAPAVPAAGVRPEPARVPIPSPLSAPQPAPAPVPVPSPAAAAWSPASIRLRTPEEWDLPTRQSAPPSSALLASEVDIVFEPDEGDAPNHHESDRTIAIPPRRPGS